MGINSFFSKPKKKTTPSIFHILTSILFFFKTNKLLPPFANYTSQFIFLISLLYSWPVIFRFKLQTYYSTLFYMKILRCILNIFNCICTGKLVNLILTAIVLFVISLINLLLF